MSGCKTALPLLTFLAHRYDQAGAEEKRPSRSGFGDNSGWPQGTTGFAAAGCWHGLCRLPRGCASPISARSTLVSLAPRVLDPRVLDPRVLDPRVLDPCSHVPWRRRSSAVCRGRRRIGLGAPYRWAAQICAALAHRPAGSVRGDLQVGSAFRRGRANVPSASLGTTRLRSDAA
jgi:hypothetical protein